MNKRNILIAFLILLCSFVLINNYYSSDLHLTQVKVISKEQAGNTYVIQATNLDFGNLEFKIKHKEKINVITDTEVKTNNEAQYITNYWTEIETGKEYHVTFNVLRFPYTLFSHEIKLRKIYLD